MLQINVLKRMYVFRRLVSISVKSKESLYRIHPSKPSGGGHFGAIRGFPFLHLLLCYGGRWLVLFSHFVLLRMFVCCCNG